LLGGRGRKQKRWYDGRGLGKSGNCRNVPQEIKTVEQVVGVGTKLLMLPPRKKDGSEMGGGKTKDGLVTRRGGTTW